MLKDSIYNYIAGLIKGFCFAVLLAYVTGFKLPGQVDEYIRTAYNLGQEEKKCYTDDIGMVRLSLDDVEDLL